jgi:spore germination protein GerM
MSRRLAGLILALALLLVVGGLLWWWLSGKGHGLLGGKSDQAVAEPSTAPVSLILYFPADGGALASERRELQVTDAPKDRIRKIVQALLAGPKQRGLYRPFPEGVTLGGLQLADGIAYVNLAWEGHDDPPASGSTEEIQRLYSLVDSIGLNVPEARGVVLLWNGAQRADFSGHLDLSLPLAPDRALVAR